MINYNGDFAPLAKVRGQDGNHDLTIPIIIGGLMVVDGFGRIKTALKEDLSSLPGVILTEDELEECIVGYMSDLNQ